MLQIRKPEAQRISNLFQVELGLYDAKADNSNSGPYLLSAFSGIYRNIYLQDYFFSCSTHFCSIHFVVNFMFVSLNKFVSLPSFSVLCNNLNKVGVNCSP